MCWCTSLGLSDKRVLPKPASHVPTGVSRGYSRARLGRFGWDALAGTLVGSAAAADP